MAQDNLKIPRLLVEFILLGPEDDRRQLQDSPILGDVWIKFAASPGERVELLITPHKESAAAKTAAELNKALRDHHSRRNTLDDLKRDGGAQIAYLQGVVAGRLTFEEVLRLVVPRTSWWNEKRISDAMPGHLGNEQNVADALRSTCDAAARWLDDDSRDAVQDFQTHERFSSLAAVLLWAAAQPAGAEGTSGSMKAQTKRILERIENHEQEIARTLVNLQLPRPVPDEMPLIWTVSLNRRATPALWRSVPAVKADAARTLFRVDCSEIVWAVIDSGIDATHYAFRSTQKDPRTGRYPSRVKKSFDFTAIRTIVSLDNLDDGVRDDRARKLLEQKLMNPLTLEDAKTKLHELARNAEAGHAVNWELVEPFVEVNPDASRPRTNHGTHVAGILAASRQGAAAAATDDKERAAASSGTSAAAVETSSSDWSDGMCPDITIYDFRVLAPELRETEFAIIATLQYIRFVNERFSYMTIHGANLSLSIPHDVRNFACGRTPICNECERLVNGGVVVVAAAGNRGYQNFETSEGLYEGYAAFSVTDPGNADGVITVGATHRFWPHTYGVSFFSSRGPTGDGRLKPDLVAPGEKIRAPLRDQSWGDLDGTSMAAPHVSGAAAMLMARYSELVGQPRRIKSILCQSATDLGRERSFQGHGMLDVLRAFQSI